MSASLEKGLNWVASTPSGNPRIAPTSFEDSPASCIIVVTGETTDDPLGAFRITLERTSPDDVSTVVSSVTTVKLLPAIPLIEKDPSGFVSTKGSSELSEPSLS